MDLAFSFCNSLERVFFYSNWIEDLVGFFLLFPPELLLFQMLLRYRCPFSFLYQEVVLYTVMRSITTAIQIRIHIHIHMPTQVDSVVSDTNDLLIS